LDLPTRTQYSESDIEQALIDKLQAFLLELGKGFTFVARQSRITFAEKQGFDIADYFVKRDNVFGWALSENDYPLFWDV